MTRTLVFIVLVAFVLPLVLVALALRLDDPTTVAKVTGRQTTAHFKVPTRNLDSGTPTTSQVAISTTAGRNAERTTAPILLTSSTKHRKGELWINEHAKRTRGNWQNLADCEAGERRKHPDGSYEVLVGTANWHVHDRLHSGGLQFAYSTWRRAGGLRFAPAAHLATMAQQIQVAKDWLRRTSPRQWPTCGPVVGLSMLAVR